MPPALYRCNARHTPWIPMVHHPGFGIGKWRSRKQTERRLRSAPQTAYSNSGLCRSGFAMPRQPSNNSWTLYWRDSSGSNVLSTLMTLLYWGIVSTNTCAIFSLSSSESVTLASALSPVFLPTTGEVPRPCNLP